MDLCERWESGWSALVMSALQPKVSNPSQLGTDLEPVELASNLGPGCYRGGSPRHCVLVRLEDFVSHFSRDRRSLACAKMGVLVSAISSFAASIVADIFYLPARPP